jgi:Co/Zn/Cd efflux system component
LAEHERVALAIIALITSMMAFIVGTVAFPAASTALAADALTFVQHSISAGFALRTSMGRSRPRWTVQLQGIGMMLLGGLVCVLAIQRLVFGSLPDYGAMVILGVVALFAHLVVCAIMLHSRGQLTSALSLWRFTRPDAVGNIAVIAAAIMVAGLGSNVPDLVIGAGMAGLFVIAGWRIALTGRADAGAR